MFPLTLVFWSPPAKTTHRIIPQFQHFDGFFPNGHLPEINYVRILWTSKVLTNRQNTTVILATAAGFKEFILTGAFHFDGNKWQEIVFVKN